MDSIGYVILTSPFCGRLKIESCWAPKAQRKETLNKVFQATYLELAMFVGGVLPSEGNGETQEMYVFNGIHVKKLVKCLGKMMET